MDIGIDSRYNWDLDSWSLRSCIGDQRADLFLEWHDAYFMNVLFLVSTLVYQIERKKSRLTDELV